MEKRIFICWGCGLDHKYPIGVQAPPSRALKPRVKKPTPIRRTSLGRQHFPADVPRTGQPCRDSCDQRRAVQGDCPGYGLPRRGRDIFARPWVGDAAPVSDPLMQAYIKLALGFPGKLLTPEEYQRLRAEPIEAPYSKGVYGYGCEFRYFTEDGDSKDWGAVLLRELGEAPNAGKCVTPNQLQAVFAQADISSPETQAELSKVLAAAGLSRLLDKVEPIVFLTEY